MITYVQYKNTKNYYIPNCKRPITSHHSYHLTVQYPTVLYSCYWTVVIGQSADELPGKVNDKSRWPKKASEWGSDLFRLIVCRPNTSENIMYHTIINNYVLRIVLINFIIKDIWLRTLETKNTNKKCPTYSFSACLWMDVRSGSTPPVFPLPKTSSSWLRHTSLTTYWLW